MTRFRQRICDLKSVNPYNYAREVRRALGHISRRIDHRECAELLGLDIVEFSLNEVPSGLVPKSYVRGKTLAFLPKDPTDRNLFILDSIADTQKRWAALHEEAHDMLPGHRTLVVPESERTLGGGLVGTIERQANACAAYIAMYPPLFRSDCNDLRFGVGSLELLSKAYGVSMESTGIHYARMHEQPVAFFMARSSSRLSDKERSQQDADPAGLRLFAPEEFVRPSCGTPSFSEGDVPTLSMGYVIPSRTFPFWIRPGTPIQNDSAIAAASREGFGYHAITPVYVRHRGYYDMEVSCRPWGPNGDVIGFLRIRKPVINLPMFEERKPPNEGMFVCASIFGEAGRKRPVHSGAAIKDARVGVAAQP